MRYLWRFPFSQHFRSNQLKWKWTRGSKGNFPENTDGLRRNSTFSFPTGWNGNYRSICRKLKFLLRANLLALTPIRFIYPRSTNEIASFSPACKKPFPFAGKFPEFQTENVGYMESAPGVCCFVLFYGVSCNISNTGESVSSGYPTPRRELEKRRVTPIIM